MSRVLKFAIVFGTICAYGVVIYAAQIEWFALSHYDGRLQRGVVGLPHSAKDLAGTYYTGDGTGYNIYLTLMADETYSATCKGCLGTYGESSGEWRTDGDRITFQSSRETDMMRGHFKDLDILHFRDHWIFLPTDNQDRLGYEQFGVSRLCCYQNTNSIYPGT